MRPLAADNRKVILFATAILQHRFAMTSPTKGFCSCGCLLPALWERVCDPSQLPCPPKLNRRDRQGKAARLGKFLGPAFPTGGRRVRDDGGRKDSGWQRSACERETALCLFSHEQIHPSSFPVTLGSPIYVLERSPPLNGVTTSLDACREYVPMAYVLL